MDRIEQQRRREIDSQLATLKKAKARKGQIPHDHKSRNEAYSQFMASLRAQKDQQESMAQSPDTVTLPITFLQSPYSPCVKNVVELNPITIQQLQLETHHRGSYLLLRAITPPKLTTGVSVLAEDETGDPVVLQLCHESFRHAGAALEIVGIGKIFLVKEPYFQVMPDGEYGIRVDHSTDVVYIDKYNLTVPVEWLQCPINFGHTAESLRVQGNARFAEKKYQEAISEYSHALRKPATEKEIETIKCNRSLAYLKSEQFDAAIADTAFPNFAPTCSEKMLYRPAQALYCLERYTECCEVLEKLLSRFPGSDAGKALLTRARARLLEQSKGAYDFKKLLAEAQKNWPPYLDHATFIGPVEIKQTTSKGRGLFVTASVKAGDLLLCEKAFCSVYATNSAFAGDTDSARLSWSVDCKTERVSCDVRSALVNSIAQKLHRNPSLSPTFSALDHGSYKASSTSTVDTGPVVDTFLVSQIAKFNAFACSASMHDAHKELLPDQEEGEELHRASGVWIQASYINHSDLCTARRAFIGDMIIVRATCDMEPGTEITFWYNSPLRILLESPRQRFKAQGFICDCALCQDSETLTDATRAERQRLLRAVRVAFNKPKKSALNKVERLLGDLNKTYKRPADEVPRLLLWDQQQKLVRFYAIQANMLKTLEASCNALALVGYVVVGADASTSVFAVVKWGMLYDYVVETFLFARTAFEALGAVGNAKQADEYARTAYTIMVGEGTSFDEMYGNWSVKMYCP